MAMRPFAKLLWKLVVLHFAFFPLRYVNRLFVDKDARQWRSQKFSMEGVWSQWRMQELGELGLKLLSQRGCGGQIPR